MERYCQSAYSKILSNALYNFTQCAQSVTLTPIYIQHGIIQHFFHYCCYINCAVLQGRPERKLNQLIQFYYKVTLKSFCKSKNRFPPIPSFLKSKKLAKAPSEPLVPPTSHFGISCLLLTIPLALSLVSISQGHLLIPLYLLMKNWYPKTHLLFSIICLNKISIRISAN